MKKSLTCLLIGVLTAASVKGLALPAISKQPTDQFVSLGANVTFKVSATGAAPLSYQWLRENTPVSGAIGASLVITNVSSAAAGSYLVVVTDPSGSVTSRVARLEVDLTFTKITSGLLVTEASSFTSCAWGDFDDDGYLDIVVGAGSADIVPFEPLHLYRNNGPGPDEFTFTKVTTGPVAATLVNAAGLAWADYDNDGRLDLVVANNGPPTVLFHNEGNGAFIKSTNSPIATLRTFGENVGWADYNRDGYLDLFVSNYDANRVRQNDFYRNNGDGTFAKLTTNDVGSFLADTGGMTTVSWSDYDNDGDPDLFINRPHNNETSLFYRNNGEGTFTKMTRDNVGNIVNDARQTGVGGSGAAAWGDYDNDGDLDVFVTVRGAASEAPSNLLWRNNGNGTFTGMTTNEVGAIVGELGLSMTCAWADYDNDGWLDLFVSRPGLEGRSEDNFLYHNNGNGTFAKVTTGSPVRDGGRAAPRTQWGVAWGDFNNDGFMDLFVCNGYPFPPRAPHPNLLYRNNGNANHWLKLKLIGTVSNRSAVGAKVRVKATIAGKTVWQMREISGSSGRYGFQDMRPNFGLGDATNVETLRIEWPSGAVQELHNVAANQLLTITEPPRLEAIIKLANGTSNLEVNGWTGFVYDIQTTSDLKNWMSLGMETNLTGTLRVSDPVAPSSKRFYRLRVP